MNSLALLVLLLQLVSGQTAASPLDRIRAKTPVDPVTNLTPVQIAGQYSNPSWEYIKRSGGALSGDDLYIFSDQTYVYCEWADISPTTIIDKGTWSFSGSVLELKSDPEITWGTRLERRILVVRRLSHTKEILLMGIEEELPYFEKEAGDDPAGMLLIVGRQRRRVIKPAGAARLKARLMQESWRPESFRKNP